MARHPYVELGLILAGDTRWQQEGRLRGQTDLPLSELGRSAVTSAARLMIGRRPAVVFHPGDEAATETARIIAGAIGARTKVQTELADPDLGLLEGLLRSEFQERYPRRSRQWEDDPIGLVPPEGEPFTHARDRVFGTVARLLRKARPGGVAVVLHPIALAFLRDWLEIRPAGNEPDAGGSEGRVVYFAVTPGIVDAMSAQLVGS